MKYADRVKETSATTGTGTLTLGGAVAGFRTFLSALVDGDLVPYVIEAGNGTDWETGIGTYSAGTLARTVISASSNAGAAINLAAGAHTVYLGMISRNARDINYSAPVSITAAVSLTASAGVGMHHVCTGTTADYTVALPTTGLAVGDLISFEMSSALTKLVTLDAGASATIDGERYRILWARENCTLKWDGTQWTKVAGKSIPMVCQMANATDSDVALTTATVTKVPLTVSIADSTSSMADTVNGRINIKRKGQYKYRIYNAFNGGSVNQVTQTRLHKNAAFYELVSGGYFFSPEANAGNMDLGTVPCVAGDYLELFAYRVGTGSLVVYRTGGVLLVEEYLTW